MRCLYCGKELALLKRWTGGGEFCSDAHRQRYQEEYNQLALNRLLQAQPPKESKPITRTELKPKADPKPATKGEPKALPVPPPVQHEPARAVEAAAATSATAGAGAAAVAVAEAPPEQPKPADEAKAPAPLANALRLEPRFANVNIAPTSKLEPQFRVDPRPAFPGPRLPDADADQHRLQLSEQPMALALSGRVWDYATNGELRPELCEFVRTVPNAGLNFHELNLRPAITADLHRPTEMLNVPTKFNPPQASVAMWSLNIASEFPAPPVELGALARVAFETTGIDDTETPRAVAEAPAQQTAIVEEPAAAAPPSDPPVPDESPAIVAAAAEPAAPEPAALESFAEQPVPQPIPPQIHKPLPLTLHGLPAGRGKPVQVFTAASAGPLAIQSPRLNALPLRPVMLIADAPKSEAAPEAKPAPKAPTPKPAPAPVAQPAAKKPEPAPEKRKEPVSKPAAVAAPAPTPVSTPTPKPTPTPAPVPTPARVTTTDLGLPSLELSSPKSSPMKKIGIAAVVVLAAGAGIGILLKGSKAESASAGPRLVETGPAITAGDQGWITNFAFGEPGVRKTRDVSVMRPTLTLQDYRVQFEAQIESKAAGWVVRATDPKNYYVLKLEIVKPGLQPTVAFVRFAVINGEDQPRTQIPLTLSLHADTMYKIRTDVVGSRMTTYVQDQKVDDWNDEKLKTGGVGLYSERGERISLKGGLNVVPLALKN